MRLVGLLVIGLCGPELFWITIAATTETGEPTPTCVANFGGKTVWYAGQIRNIVVDLTSKYYAENVTVQLLKSKPDAPSNQWLTVGALTQFLPVRQSNRATDFNFSYTFISADVQTGMVSFNAAAMLRTSHREQP